MASNYNEEESEQLESYNFTPSRTPKLSRRQYNPSFKCDIIRRVDRGESINSIATELKVDPSNIYRWIEKRTALFQNENLDSPRLADRKQGKFPRLESELLKFLIDERKRKLGVDTKALRNKALELKETCIDDETERNNFVASKSYIKNFIKEIIYHIVSVRMFLCVKKWI